LFFWGDSAQGGIRPLLGLYAVYFWSRWFSGW